MPTFYNTQSKFGEEGPFEAESAEALADEMLEVFNGWARESGDDPEFVIANMRKAFLDGLERVVRTCGCCGRHYSLKEFVALPHPVKGEYQDAYPEPGDKVHCLLLRDCPCRQPRATLAIPLDRELEFVESE